MMKVKSGLRSGRGATVAATMAAVAAALVVQAPMAQADTAKALSCKARFNHNPMQIKGGVGVGANVVCDEKPTAFHVWLSLQHRTRDGKWIEQGADTSREIPNSWYNILAYTAHCEDRAWRAIVRIDVESGGKSVTDSVETPPTIINCNP
ncbi:hypothetical protein [Nocardia asiatica]|uniref:hypothetical protein n=1 Tax=Nocardia asiatica TaxID=209252 RepID=UPI0005B85D20|nr:hypothetical protein [Nocardia asiatica]